MFSLFFNTAFVSDSRLRLERREVDYAHKDKHLAHFDDKVCRHS